MTQTRAAIRPTNARGERSSQSQYRTVIALWDGPFLDQVRQDRENYFALDVDGRMEAIEPPESIIPLEQLVVSDVIGPNGENKFA